MSAITAKATADGLAVELNLDAALPLFLDVLADAFDDDVEAVAGLLVDLAQTRRKLHRAQELAERGDIPDHVAVSLTYGEARAVQQQLADATASTFFGRLGRAS